MIIYVDRDQFGAVTGTYSLPQHAGHEAADDGAKDVLTFLAKVSATPADTLLKRIASLEKQVGDIAAVPAVASALPVTVQPVTAEVV